MRTLRLIAASFALVLSGCTLLVEDSVGDLAPDPLLDLELRLRGFLPHIGQVTDVWLVSDSEDDIERRVHARAIFDGLTDPNQDVVLTNVVDVQRGWHVDFYSDLNESIPTTGVFRPDPPMRNDAGTIVFPDHQWRLPLVNGRAEFMHNVVFTDLATEPASFFLADLHLVVNELEALVDLGHLTREEFESEQRPTAEVRVFNDTDDQNTQVGLYRLSAMGMETIDITLGGILDQGVEYDVELEIDDNGRPFCLTVSGTGDAIVRNVSIAALSPCPTDEE